MIHFFFCTFFLFNFLSAMELPKETACPSNSKRQTQLYELPHCSFDTFDYAECVKRIDAFKASKSKDVGEKIKMFHILSNLTLVTDKVVEELRFHVKSRDDEVLKISSSGNNQGFRISNDASMIQKFKAVNLELTARSGLIDNFMHIKSNEGLVLLLRFLELKHKKKLKITCHCLKAC